MEERKQSHFIDEPKEAKLHRFWESLIASDNGRTVIGAKVKPTERPSLSLGYRNGIAYFYVIKGSHSHVALYIARYTEFENKQIFDYLYSHKDEIERSFGASFVWQRLDGKVPCRIRFEMYIGEFAQREANWQEIQNKMIDTMIRFQNVFSSHLERFGY
jgi:hypothetical protein